MIHGPDLYASIPKAEIHLHLEGSIDLETLLQIRARRGASAGSADRYRLKALYEHRDFIGFLAHFRDLCAELKAPADFALAVERLAERLRDDRVVHAEVMISAGIFARRGLPPDEILDAASRAAARSRSGGGPRMIWLLDGVRQWGPAGFDALLRMAVDNRRYGVVGIGLGGDESASPAAGFRSLYREARSEGLRTTLHAGECDGPRSVWEAIDLLEVDRIGHGVRAVEDAELVRALAVRRVPLECCPTSNLRTGIVADLAAHPGKRLHREGVRVTVGSDDPALFGTTIGGEWRAFETGVGMTIAEVVAIGRETIAAAFMEPVDQERLLREFDAAAQPAREES